MRIGICTGIENVKVLERMGFDYIEWSVSKVASLTEDEFDSVASLVDESSIKCEAFNGFFPNTIRLTGPDADYSLIKEYARKAIMRIARLGACVVVVGSSGARNLPEGWDRNRGIEQFKDAMKIIGDEALVYGITAVIEPLNKMESNIVNSVGEGLELVKSIKHPNVMLLADFYHMRKGNESMDIINDAGSFLKHIHIANSNGRVYPLKNDEDDYTSFFSKLKDKKYNERVSIEASTKDLASDGPSALKLLKEYTR